MLKDKKGNIVCVNRSQTQESLQDNVSTSSTKISKAAGSRLEAILAVANYTCWPMDQY